MRHPVYMEGIMITVIRCYDGQETIVGTAETWLRASALIEHSAQVDREKGEGAFYTASGEEETWTVRT